MSRKLQVTELESRITPSVTTTVGALLAMFPQGFGLPGNVQQVGSLDPNRQLTFTDATWAKIVAAAGKAAKR